MKNGQRLTDKVARELPAPATGARITYDAEVAGFGLRVTAAGARAFVLNYRTRAGRERRYTIGSFPDWQTAAARKHAADLKSRIRLGQDPLAELEAERSAPTVEDVCDRFVAEHMPRLRPASQKLYVAVIEGTARHKGIRAHFKHMAVADLRHADVADFHRSRSASPTMANRSVAVLSRMLNLAVRWGWSTSNAARGTERNPEVKRQRFLRPDEIARLTEALKSFPDQQAANIVRLLVLTGARSGEVLAMRWEDFDVGAAGVWVKPSSSTKQKAIHRVPLSAAARLVLANVVRENEWVFPGTGESGHRESIATAWPRICKAAGLVGPDGKPTVRIHDLRHTYASLLASAGLSLPIIGALLGHSQPATTARYAHLLDDPLRAATERVGALVSGGEEAELVDFAR